MTWRHPWRWSGANIPPDDFRSNTRFPVAHHVRERTHCARRTPLHPNFQPSITVNESIKPLAGTVAHNVKHSPHWSPFDPDFGSGGSADYPARAEVEKRILPPDKILKLRNPEIRIEPTNRCNYSCVMCPRETHDRAQGVMPFGFYKSVVDEVIAMGAKQITLTNFGEPFIDPGLEDKIQYASDNGLGTYIISNASLLHQPSRSELADGLKTAVDEVITKGRAVIASGLAELRLSFYGTKPDIYEKVMRGGKFWQTRKNIEEFRVLREKFGRKGISPTRKIETLLPEISIYYLDLPENHGDLEEFLDFTRDLADYIEVWKPHNFGLGKENEYREIEAAKPLHSCGRPQTGPVQINWQGIVVPCCFDYNQDIPLGNVALQTVEEVLRAGPYQELKRCHIEKTFADVPYCHRCDQLREHNNALVVSTNPRHKGRSMESIMKSPNTRPEFEMG